jgi:hypothetical protein
MRLGGLRRPLSLPPLRPASFLRSANSSSCGGGHPAPLPGSNRSDLLTFGFGPPSTLCRCDPRTTSGGDFSSASASSSCEGRDCIVDLFESRRETTAFLVELLAIVIKSDGQHFLVATLHFILSVEWEQQHSTRTAAAGRPFSRMGLSRPRRTTSTRAQRPTRERGDGGFTPRV